MGLSQSRVQIIRIHENIPWPEFLQELKELRVFPNATAANIQHGALAIDIARENDIGCRITVDKVCATRVSVSLVEECWPPHPTSMVYLANLREEIERLIRSYGPWEDRSRTRRG